MDDNDLIWNNFNKQVNNKKSLSSARDERLFFRGTTQIYSFWTYVVDLRGLEPLTSSMPWMRSSSCATGPYLLVPVKRPRTKLILRGNGRSGKRYYS
jgi:hypothetical protein